MITNTFNDEMELLHNILQIIVKKTANNQVPPIGVRFDNIHKYMFVRSLMADDESVRAYEKILLMLFACEFMPASDAWSYFGVHSEYEWMKMVSVKSDVVNLLTDKQRSTFDNSTHRNLFVSIFKIEEYAYKNICFVKPNSIVIDCGGYFGDTALYFYLKMEKTGQIHCFEPTPNYYKTIINNIKIWGLEGSGSVVPVNLGVSDSEGSIKFNTNRQFLGANGVDNDGNISVSVTTIDNYVEQNKLASVDFIKMDIEGSEMAALRGATT